ncbi:PAS domain S-box-containing protein [Hydrogenispora ethanolica]|uniref:PAS domain S-box-containing protein n=1 Tax=Hydrogenispora ethanolica TaxID=1082276 RepID=A0A4R1SBW1_HYDET|nr:PAS domain-containing protein [Hydrogenispora ethanolica]TCL77011.1 PAS domain S-box-containing protein [Hydrogenispora ethanolica]
MIYQFKTKRQLMAELRDMRRLNFFYAQVLQVRSEANRFLVKQFRQLTHKYRLAYIHTYTGFLVCRNRNWVFDQVSLSFAHLFGYDDVAELEGMPVVRVFPAERYPEFLERLDAAASGEMVLRSDGLRKDGERLPLLMTIKPIQDSPFHERYYLLNVSNLIGLNESSPRAADLISV